MKNEKLHLKIASDFSNFPSFKCAKSSSVQKLTFFLVFGYLFAGAETGKIKKIEKKFFFPFFPGFSIWFSSF